MFFTIQIDKGGSDPLARWYEWEHYSQLWVARNRVRIMLEDKPELRGHIRIIACNPGLAVNAEFR